METKEQAALRAKEYRLRNRDAINERGRARWKATKRYVRRADTLRKRKCAFCGILLKSKLVRIKQKRFCDGCIDDPQVWRHLRNLYQRRWYQKKVGIEQDSLTLAEDDGT